MNAQHNNQFDNNEYIITIVEGVTIFEETDELVLDMGD
jgi:hypothetical protein